jgi:hypothetical protein
LWVQCTLSWPEPAALPSSRPECARHPARNSSSSINNACFCGCLLNARPHCSKTPQACSPPPIPPPPATPRVFICQRPTNQPINPMLHSQCCATTLRHSAVIQSCATTLSQRFASAVHQEVFQLTHQLH